MNRRTLLKSIGSASVLGVASPLLRSQEQVARATRGMATPRIKDISVIECEPAGTRLTVVKITTDQDGLYGYGCATFTQRADLVKPAVEKYLKPCATLSSEGRMFPVNIEYAETPGYTDKRPVWEQAADAF